MPNTILWADDEIDLLKPHIMFLQAKGYDISTANNGTDALAMVRDHRYDLIILDENMPGITGLETLQRIKAIDPHVPVIMITKSEEENIMDQAVGSKIADYLIKPVNPSQILLSIKKNLHVRELMSDRTQVDYLQEFRTLGERIGECGTVADFTDVYRRLTYWEIELTATRPDLLPMLDSQMEEANAAFSRMVRRDYERWVDPDTPADGRPLLSPGLFRECIMPLLDASSDPLFLIVIDNFRLDQWMTVRPLVAEMFDIRDDMYCAILPTATQYARNAIFSGLMPSMIARMFPELWVDEDEAEGKNLNESPMISTLFERFRRPCRFSYNKINDKAASDRLLRDFRTLEHNDLNVIVLNFVDMLSHARTESKMIRELAPDNAAYRSLTDSWFRHSGTLELLRRISDRGHRVVITTDHGTVRVDNPVKVKADRDTNTALRYKLGRSLNCSAKSVFEIRQPDRFGLPSPNLSTSYLFCTGRDFFAYPNNYNHYVQYYTGTFQHGGISMQEMLVPLVTLHPKQ